MTPSPRVPRWRQTPVGGHDIRIACRLELAQADAERYLARVRAVLERAGFRGNPATPPPPGVTVLRRGGFLGDLVLDGTGIGRLVRRIGPLTHRATVLLERSDETAIVSLIEGAPVAREVADAVDGVIDELAVSGARIGGEGWMRAVDLPATSAGNPRTAATHGIH